MKKNLVLVALVLLIGVSAGAQGYVYNPDNNPAGGGGPNSWPFNLYSAWRYSFIVDASVLPSAPVKITEIAFAPTRTATFVASPFQIRMGHTTHKAFSTSGMKNFDDILGPCPTVCYNGAMKWAATANTWSDIGLMAAFGYDGKRNVCVEIRYNASGSQGVTSWTGSIPRAYTHTSYSADPYNEPAWRNTDSAAIKHRITYVKDNIVITDDTQSIGSTAAVNYINGTAGHTMQLAASMGQSPLNLGACKIFLDTDGVFFYSVMTGTPIFNGYAQVLPATGTTYGKLTLPKLPVLIGLCVFHSGITHLRGTITGCANTDGTLITK